ncbi:tyrosine-type recombinase/integrase [Methyloversatilis universalis]|uniref:tyrosine-type recombinase/integrase n=1 Tax=Methyloversatilis universalis TaxID=378211 RepID=UPI00038093AF|nr:integrase family protein [Methyloversatilis universalis]
MNRERLTLDRIARFVCPADKQQAFLWDTEAPRLAVRATAGSKSFIFEAKLHRKTVRQTIGSVQAWDIADARAEARRLQTLVDQGIDPAQERKQRLEALEGERERAQRTDALALDAWAAYIEARSPKWTPRSLADHYVMTTEGGKPKTRGRRPGEGTTTKPGILRPLLSRPLNRIDAEAVRVWLSFEIVKRPTHAALAFRLLRAFLNWCASSEHLAEQVHVDACKVRSVRDQLPKKAAKNDCLQREQLGLWFGRVRALPNPIHSAYLQVLLLTGARREELVDLRWDDVDFQWKSLTIRDKVEGERTIPLTPYVAKLLQELKARRDMGAVRAIPVRGPNLKRSVARARRANEGAARAHQWVFSSPTAASGRLQEPRISHNKALDAAGLPPLTLHGLRRSFGTLSEWVEVPVGIVAQIMGHKPSAIAEKHYRRRPLDLLRMWHTKIEGWMLAQAGIEQPDERAPNLHKVVGA